MRVLKIMDDTGEQPLSFLQQHEFTALSHCMNLLEGIAPMWHCCRSFGSYLSSLLITAGDGKLDKSELKWGLKDYGIVLSNPELDHVFSYFDKDKSGTIDRNEFLSGLRGPMSKRRLNLVQQAFNILDSSGDGKATLQELQAIYDCRQHPEVKVWCMTIALSLHGD